MTKKSIKNILAKYLQNEATEADIQHLLMWIEDSENLKAFKGYISLNHLVNDKFKRFNSVEAFEKTLKRIDKEKKIFKLYNRNFVKYAVAASIVLLISLAFIFNNSSEQVETPIIVDNSIEIGTDKATLTLENGTNIVLEKGQNYQTKNLNSNGKELVYNQGNNPDKDIMYNYLTIPRGGQFYVELSDGTKVWLNSESKLKYPVTFTEGTTRNVELIYGEAYFDVSPSTAHNGAKFKVKSLIQEVIVLGTEFNIKAYKDEDIIYTTLVEGKVEIGNDISKKILKPNQQSVINIENNDLTVTEVDVYSEISWKNGLFSFKDKSLKDIMKVLSRWYNIDVVFVDKSLEDVRFKGVLNKNQNIEEILILIKNTNFINAYDIKDNTIIIRN